MNMYLVFDFYRLICSEKNLTGFRNPLGLEMGDL